MSTLNAKSYDPDLLEKIYLKIILKEAGMLRIGY